MSVTDVRKGTKANGESVTSASGGSTPPDAGRVTDVRNVTWAELPEVAQVREAMQRTFGGGLTYLLVTTPDGRLAGGKHRGGGVFHG